MNKKIINKAKKYFQQIIHETWPDIYDLYTHVPEAERWAMKITEYHKEADLEVVLLAVWLHDIGHYYALKKNIDHAVFSEKMAKKFLTKENYPKDKTASVMHCIRAHRSRDVLPETLEAKIMACADSASHFTWGRYMVIARDISLADSLSKMERDYKDLNAFPEIREMLEPLYKDWQKVFNHYNEIKL